MSKRKTLRELTLKDNFMFAAVMAENPEDARLVLERILGFSISHVEVDREKTIIYNPEYRGIRLDVYAKDDNNTHYNVEMQVDPTPVELRSRYYHDQLDMELLASGHTYEELPDTYVIFICDYDPFQLGLYRYTCKTVFEENPRYNYNDGSHTIFLSTKGHNITGVPPELVTFLDFIAADLQHSTKDYNDSLVEKLQKSINRIKSSREMGNRFMLFEELLQKEYNDGKNDGRIEGTINSILSLINAQNSDELKISLMSITDMNSLNELHQKAALVFANVATMDDFNNTLSAIINARK